MLAICILLSINSLNLVNDYSTSRRLFYFQTSRPNGLFVFNHVDICKVRYVEEMDQVVLCMSIIHKLGSWVNCEKTLPLAQVLPYQPARHKHSPVTSSQEAPFSHLHSLLQLTPYLPSGHSEKIN